ncbi:MAG: hypothetical protein N2688_06360 [Burkholderiaceae bacterium]|nr:hypothetical protein [Burkholderiaceae bacterium]
MQQLHMTLTFLTPAFLGDAEQNARWRTPPLKHLLRRWWRVVHYAKRDPKNAGFDVLAMRRAEGRLFGHAWLEDDDLEDAVGRRPLTAARRSLVRLRLWPALEADDLAAVWRGGGKSGVAPLESNLSTSHAWFGLIQRGGGLPDRQRIEANQARRLSLAFPQPFEEDLRRTLALIHGFGTVGSRSRGGWGSVALHAADRAQAFVIFRAQALRPYCEPLARCLQRDWMAAFACDPDGRPWVWRSAQRFDSWHDALRVSATLRRELRTSLRGQPDLRAALGFAGDGRMASPLHWKVLADGSKWVLQAAAMPHAVPVEARNALSVTNLDAAWKTVRAFLDKKLQRID